MPGHDDEPGSCHDGDCSGNGYVHLVYRRSFTDVVSRHCYVPGAMPRVCQCPKFSARISKVLRTRHDHPGRDAASSLHDRGLRCYMAGHLKGEVACYGESAFCKVTTGLTGPADSVLHSRGLAVTWHVLRSPNSVSCGVSPGVSGDRPVRERPAARPVSPDGRCGVGSFDVAPGPAGWARCYRP